MKTALITGVCGQDGSYLAELLLSQGYTIHGIALPHDGDDCLINARAFAGDRFQIHRFSLMEFHTLARLLEALALDECYHLAAASYVNYDAPHAGEALLNNIATTQNILMALYQKAPGCRFFYAGTSEMFGTVDQTPQNESTRFQPRNPYGISKVAGHHLVDYYRQEMGLRASTGILYNHESPRRGLQFVTRKITQGAAKIKLGLQKKLLLGNLEAKRDWGYAPDYVLAMTRMLQQTPNEDYIIASGKLHTVREFTDMAFRELGLDYRDYVEVSDDYYREEKGEILQGDISKIRKAIGWHPEKQFSEIVVDMVRADFDLLSKGR